MLKAAPALVAVALLAAPAVFAAAPLPPGPIDQANPTTVPIPVGGFADGADVLFRGVVTDPDTDPVRLQVEIKPVGTPFIDAPSGESPPVPSGNLADLTLSGLTEGGYHWQARAVDGFGAFSPWVPFGANPEPDADFVIDPNPPDPPDTLEQRGGGVSVPVGGALEPNAIFRGSVTDPDGDDVRLEVEVRPVGTPFSAPTAQSALAPSGSTIDVAHPTLSPDSHHWRARSIDASGRVSAFVSFGGNTESEADFVVPPIVPALGFAGLAVAVAALVGIGLRAADHRRLRDR